MLYCTPFSMSDIITKQASFDAESAIRDTQDDLEFQIEQRTRELRRTISDLEKAHQIKDDFLVTLSHELWTPLTVVLGWLYVLRQGDLSEEKVRHALEIIYQNACRQKELIEDLMNVSRIISGKLTVNPEPVDPLPIIHHTVDSFLPLIDRKQLQVEVDLDCKIGPVWLDPVRFQQIIWNLLNNAVKFTPAGGSIRVNLRRAAAQAVISVSDSGEGIAPEFLPYVFDRYRQSDLSRSRYHGGLGLGLSLVRHLVELHRGIVSVQSRGCGQGTTFAIQIPMTLEPPSPLPARADKGQETVGSQA